MENPRSIFSRKLDGRTALLLVAAAIFLVSVAVVTFYLLQPTYTPLYTGLSVEDTAPVVSALKEQKKHYQIRNGGTEIWVQGRDVDSIRIAMAGKAGIGSGLVGYEVFDKGDYGATDFSQKINFQRAMQGELARAVMKMKDVTYARVFLSLPEDKLFSNLSEQAKASVVLSLKPGISLSAVQIAGIQMLVAGSIPNLKKENVSVHNESGEVISKGLENDEEGPPGNLKAKMDLDEYLTNKALAVLYKAVGFGNGYVAVNVEMNFDDINKQSETVFPKDAGVGAVTVYQKTSESRRMGGRQGFSARQDNEAQDIIDQQNESRYEVSKSTESKISEKGKIVQISAGVVVTSSGISADKVEEIKKLIGSSIGLNESRGDRIEVSVFDGGLHNNVDSGVKRDNVSVEPSKSKQDGRSFLDAHLVGISFVWILAVLLSFWLISVLLVIFVYRRINRRRVLDNLQNALGSV